MLGCFLGRFFGHALQSLQVARLLEAFFDKQKEGTTKAAWVVQVAAIVSNAAGKHEYRRLVFGLTADGYFYRGMNTTAIQVEQYQTAVGYHNFY